MSGVKENGLTPRMHGNERRRSKHPLLLASTKYVVRILYSSADQHTVLLPGQISGYSCADLQLHCEQQSCVEGIPWSCSRSERYTRTASCLLHFLLSLECNISSHESDLCCQCQQTAPQSVCQFIQLRKSIVLGDAWELKIERSHYKSVCEGCKSSMHTS